MSCVPGKKIIALTGSMGSGKSTAAAWLKTIYPVVDCDAINAALLQTGKEGWRQLVQAGIIEEKELDKAKLAGRMFSDPKLKKQVEQILHPLIMKHVFAFAEKAPGPLVFAEVPLLFENHLETCFDEVWCVVCTEKTALDRLLSGRGISRQDALARLQHQMPPVQKASVSNAVIENDGSEEELKKQLALLLESRGYGTEK